MDAATVVNYPSAKASGLPVSTISSCSHSENGFVEEEISTGVNFLCPGGIENFRNFNPKMRVDDLFHRLFLSIEK